MEFREYWNIALKRGWIIILVAIVAAVAAFGVSQIMSETLIITAVGGALGIGITLAICAAFPSAGLTEFVGQPKVSMGVSAMTVGLLGTIGLLAGWFPARTASRLDPVVAMKT